MKTIIVFILSTLPLISGAAPAPFPVFLKSGFSTVLEFDEIPTRVVLGDSQSFQVEKLDKSIVIRTLTPYAVGNMFVYFRAKETQLFILSASEDAEPTYYHKFQSPPPLPKILPQQQTTRKTSTTKRSVRVTKAQFDAKKDYLTIELEIAASSDGPVRPNWELVRLAYKNTAISPYKLWSSRKEVQRDTKVTSRFIFAKPNIPRNLKEVTLILPVLGSNQPFKLPIGVVQ